MQKEFHINFIAPIKFVQVEYNESCFTSSLENVMNEYGMCIVLLFRAVIEGVIMLGSALVMPR